MQSACRILLATLLVAIVATASASKVGTRVTLTQEGLSRMATQALPTISTALTGLSVAGPHNHTDVPVIGTIDYYVKQILVKSVNIGSVGLNFRQGMENEYGFGDTVCQSSLSTSPAVVDLSLSSVSLSIAVEFHYRQRSWPHIQDTALASVTTKKANVQGAAAVCIESTKKPYITIPKLKAQLGDFNLEITKGDHDWLYAIILNIFRSSIEGAIESAIADDLSGILEDMANEELNSYPMQVEVLPGLLIDFHFTAPVQVLSGQELTIGVLGEFFSSTSPSPSSLSPSPLPTAAINASVPVQIAVSDFTLNTGLEVLYAMQRLTVAVLSEDVPDSAPVQLNTKSLRLVLPQLYNKYPNVPVDLGISASSAPVVTFSSKNGISATASALLTVYARTSTHNSLSAGPVPKAGDVDAFGLNVDVKFGGRCDIDAETLKFQVTVDSGDFSLNHTNVGAIPSLELQGLNDLMKLLTNSVTNYFINKYLGDHGLPIPIIEGVKLQSSTIQYGDGYVLAATGATFSPTFSAAEYAKLRTDISSKIRVNCSKNG